MAVPEERLGDGPIEEEHRDLMRAVGEGLDGAFNPQYPGHPRKVAFVLLITNFGDEDGRANYISNADREGVLAMLKYQVARFEGQPDVEGHA